MQHSLWWAHAFSSLAFHQGTPRDDARCLARCSLQCTSWGCQSHFTGPNSTQQDVTMPMPDVQDCSMHNARLHTHTLKHSMLYYNTTAPPLTQHIPSSAPPGGVLLVTCQPCRPGLAAGAAAHHVIHAAITITFAKANPPCLAGPLLAKTIMMYRSNDYAYDALHPGAHACLVDPRCTWCCQVLGTRLCSGTAGKAWKVRSHSCV